MMQLKPAKLREVTWEEVREQVRLLAPDIFAAIEQISPDGRYKLYEAEYPYGAQIVGDNGIFNIPNEKGELIPIISPSINSMIKEEFSYNYPRIPAGLVLEGSTQVYFEKNKKIIACRLFKPGSVIAIQALLDAPHFYQPTHIFRITSGARTPQILASLADKRKLQNLRKAFDFDLPDEFKQDQWQLLKAISNSSKSSINWYFKVLFFGRALLPNLDSNQPLRTALLERFFNTSLVQRHNFALTMGRDSFFNHISKRNKKIDLYVIRMVRHLLDMSLGEDFSYRPAETNDLTGPFMSLSKILISEYGLKNTAPIFMTPTQYNNQIDPYGYASIQLPTSDIYRDTNTHSRYLMDDFREVRFALEQFIEFNNNQPHLEIIPFDVRNYHYEFYAFDANGTENFKNSETIFEGDPRIDPWLSLGPSNHVYARNSFLRAAVRFSRKK